MPDRPCRQSACVSVREAVTVSSTGLPVTEALRRHNDSSEQVTVTSIKWCSTLVCDEREVAYSAFSFPVLLEQRDRPFRDRGKIPRDQVDWDHGVHGWPAFGSLSQIKLWSTRASKQEAQLMLTNRCDAFRGQPSCTTCTKVTKHSTIPCVRYSFLLVCNSNFVFRTRRFSDIRLQECRDLEIRVRGHSRSLKVVPFDRLCMVSY